jgi:hypothetical protein
MPSRCLSSGKLPFVRQPVSPHLGSGSGIAGYPARIFLSRDFAGMRRVGRQRSPCRTFNRGMSRGPGQSHHGYHLSHHRAAFHDREEFRHLSPRGQARTLREVEKRRAPDARDLRFWQGSGELLRMRPSRASLSRARAPRACISRATWDLCHLDTSECPACSNCVRVYGTGHCLKRRR